jgi:dATP pyrophosphohydrolase
VPRRVPFAVLVLPYSVELDGAVSYALFRGPGLQHRAWHVLAGEGVRGETPLEAARREAWQLARVPSDAAYLALDSRATIELQGLPCGRHAEHAFAVRVCPDEVRPRRRPLEHHWVSYEIATGLLHDQAERDALWELRHRLGRPAACC